MACYLNQNVEANDEIKFQITFDSHETQFVKIKNELLGLINTTLAHVDEKSIPVLLSGDLSLLKQQSREVYFKEYIVFPVR